MELWKERIVNHHAIVPSFLHKQVGKRQRNPRILTNNRLKKGNARGQWLGLHNHRLEKSSEFFWSKFLPRIWSLKWMVLFLLMERNCCFRNPVLLFLLLLLLLSEFRLYLLWTFINALEHKKLLKIDAIISCKYFEIAFLFSCVIFNTGIDFRNHPNATKCQEKQNTRQRNTRNSNRAVFWNPLREEKMKVFWFSHCFCTGAWQKRWSCWLYLLVPWQKKHMYSDVGERLVTTLDDREIRQVS